MRLQLPRYVIAKELAGGRVGFFFNVPTKFRKRGCTVPNTPLGTRYDQACDRAVGLNGLLDEWLATSRGLPSHGPSTPIVGTVGWLFATYRGTKSYLEKVAVRSRPDYERTMALIEAITTKSGDRVRDRQIRSVSPLAADRLYEILLQGPNGERPRQAEKAVALCRRAWRVVYRLHPQQFNKLHVNPWEGVALKKRVKKKKPAVSRDDTYRFAWGAIELGKPEAAAAAVICFEFLQRPENVLAGALRWLDYRGKEMPTAIRIEHYKTGVLTLHPLQDNTGTLFYPDAEAIFQQLPRRGIAMILRTAGKGAAKPYSYSGFEKLVQTLRKKIEGVPSYFTLDACRHGGMTELEEAELTEGQGRALSGHKTAQSYRGYAKETLERALAATRKRHAHVLANAQSTNVQNGGGEAVQNETAHESKRNAK